MNVVLARTQRYQMKHLTELERIVTSYLDMTSYKYQHAWIRLSYLNIFRQCSNIVLKRPQTLNKQNLIVLNRLSQFINIGNTFNYFNKNHCFNKNSLTIKSICNLTTWKRYYNLYSYNSYYLQHIFEQFVQHLQLWLLQLSKCFEVAVEHYEYMMEIFRDW